MEPILLYDTTLRDGTQGENINFSAEEKIRIAQRLDDLGIHYIEGGWPGSNPRDKQFFKLAKKARLKSARLAAFGSTRKPGVQPQDDQNLTELIKSDTTVITIFGKSWDLHVEQIMYNTLDENLAMIQETVAYLKQQDREIIYDAEHFFDGYKGNRDYAVQTVVAALKGGADAVVLCDTNGGTLPFEIETIINEVEIGLRDYYRLGPDRPLPVKIGIHAHNDCGLAVANSITAVRAGATMVHGTINGYGERCGNADLTSIIPILALKMNRPCVAPEKLAKLKKEQAARKKQQLATEKKLEQLESERQAKASEIKVLGKEVDHALAEIAETTSRHKALKQLEESLQGFHQGVREVMKAVKAKRFNHIHGVLAQLIEIDNQHEKAIEAASEGAESTRAMQPTIGRARWFTERSQDEIDPGAVSGSIIVKTVGEYLLG